MRTIRTVLTNGTTTTTRWAVYGNDIAMGGHNFINGNGIFTNTTMRREIVINPSLPYIYLNGDDWANFCSNI